jgi:mono/diheme cytochrome c family protein
MAGLFAICGWIYVHHTSGFSTRQFPSGLERWVARSVRQAAIPSEAKTMKNPVVSDASALGEARAHWADHCANCHANNGSGDIAMGKGMYPPPPDMRQAETQQLTDGELFFVIKNGIRLTGMPAWGDGDADDLGSWKLVHFIRHLPQMTFDEEKAMEKLNPKSREEFEQEDAEAKFLRGEDVDETALQHHHH